MQWAKWTEQSGLEIFLWQFLVTHELLLWIQRTPDDKEFIWLAAVSHHIPRTSNFFNSRYFIPPLYEVWTIDVSKAEANHTGYWPWLVKNAFFFKNHFVGEGEKIEEDTQGAAGYRKSWLSYSMAFFHMILVKF